MLIEAPDVNSDKQQTVMLTIDLTEAVMNEVRNNRDIGVIIAYHPPIFRALKRFTASDPLQARLLECISRGISIYSPHTALDATKGGSAFLSAENLF